MLILLTPLDLALAAALVAASALLGFALQLGCSGRLMFAALRTVVQLLLVGFVLKALFGHVSLPWVALVAAFMLGVAGYETMARQRRRLTGWRGYGIGVFSMFVSSFSVAILALAVIIGASPWYSPQYAIPLLGMLLGNAMNGVSLALDRLTQGAWENRCVIEARLMLGHSAREALEDLRRDSIRSGMIPTINAMAAAGVVSLPGMMTGQILAGSPPGEAVKYQILVLFLIAAATMFGAVTAVALGARSLFDARDRLRVDRITGH